jgi:Na+/H+ antiporter NhaD/arsenite permease-like protein
MLMKKILLILFLIIPEIMFGSANHEFFLDGTMLSIWWIVPFIGILMSIALFPLINPKFWHKHFGKVSFFWATSLLVPMIISDQIGVQLTLYEFIHIMLIEYVPFIILLLALFTISGGIRLTGHLVGSPIVNVMILVFGTAIASWMGTTGAAMLLIRPIIRANAWRKQKVHVIVFFIFLVANIGGSLSPLGDPPLFLGFLHGIDFFWVTSAMFLPMVFMVISLLIIFYALDTYYYNREKEIPKQKGNISLGVEGGFNLFLIIGVIFSVMISGFWKPGIHITIYHVHLEVQNLLRDILLIGLTALSWKITPLSVRKANEFTWFPIREVAKLFAGIFITILPAIAILKAGTSGALSGVINSVSGPNGPINIMYFWACGILSSFLDNAPTYVVFFNTAGGNPQVLMGELYTTLLAISAGAVFMGANTYIGNAPNFMVKSISEQSGIEMPSFFGFMTKYSIPILIPLFVLVSFIFF